MHKCGEEQGSTQIADLEGMLQPLIGLSSARLVQSCPHASGQVPSTKLLRRLPEAVPQMGRRCDVCTCHSEHTRVAPRHISRAWMLRVLDWECLSNADQWLQQCLSAMGHGH